MTCSEAERGDETKGRDQDTACSQKTLGKGPNASSLYWSPNAPRFSVEFNSWLRFLVAEK